MKSSTPHNFLVIFMPAGGETVADMKIIDAWASSSNSIQGARRTADRHAAEGRYADHGTGAYEVVRTVKSSRTNLFA